MAVHGAEGYGNYWLIIELLSQLSADEGKEPRLQCDEYFVAALIHTKKHSMIWSIIHDFDLFVIEMGADEREYFYSRRLLRDFHEAVIMKGYEDDEPSDEASPLRSKRQLSDEARAKMANGGKKYRPSIDESKVEEGKKEGTSKVEEGKKEGTRKVEEGKKEGTRKVEEGKKEGRSKVERKVKEGSEEGTSKVAPPKSKVNGGDNRGGKAPKTIRQEDLEREGEKARRFSPPSLQEVKDEVERLGYAIDPERFIAHYESNGWMIGKNKMKSWKSALVTWHKRQIEEDSKRTAFSTHRPSYSNAAYHPERTAPPSTPQDEMAKWLALDHDNRAILKRNFPAKYADFPD